tara:strand:+ start:263 stop:886 length:624 start_codon:yes stop_codon:yes gene_type:complete
MFKFSRLKKSIPSPHILYNYLNQPVKRLREALGLVDSNELTPGATETIPSQVKKIEDKSFSIGGQAYDTYSLKAWTVVSGDYAYGLNMGMINVSQGLMLITKDSTNLSADDTASSTGGWVNGPLTSGDGISAGSGSTFVEDDGTSEVILCNGPMYINQDNGISGTDDNYMFLILAALAALPLTFDAEIYVDIEFVVEAGAKVKHIKF